MFTLTVWLNTSNSRDIGTFLTMEAALNHVEYIRHYEEYFGTEFVLTDAIDNEWLYVDSNWELHNY